MERPCITHGTFSVRIPTLWLCIVTAVCVYTAIVVTGYDVVDEGKICNVVLYLTVYIHHCFLLAFFDEFIKSVRAFLKV